ncbi:Sodium/solute symporter superfamily, partial [Sesbania bispinosa]
GGVTLGPSILGHNSAFADRIFPSKGRNVLDTLAFFGFMLFIFILGVKIDPTIIFRSGRRTFTIGILGFFVPYTLAGMVVFLLNRFASLDDDVSNVLPTVVEIQCITCFPVISCFLAELQILNSEIGRLASSSSLVCDICFCIVASIKFATKLSFTKSIGVTIGSVSSTTLLVLFIVFVVHPAALWAIQQTPEGKPVQEIYICGVLVTLMFFGFMGEVIGLNAIVVSFMVGLAIPDGPPLGAALVDKLDCFVSVVFIPILFVVVGLRTDVYAIQKMKNWGIIQLIICIAFCGKIIGSLLPLLFCRVPFRDALSLGLIMNCKGTVELALLIDLKLKDAMSDECFAILVLTLVLVTGIVAPVVKALYDPSRRFLAYRRRTIMHHNNDEELRILACIHKQDNVLATLNLLAASNPTESSHIDLVVLHLVKLVGQASSLLVAHIPRENPSQRPTQSEKIFSSFSKFEQAYRGKVTLHCYKGISPYATMHNDVCYLALEKRTTFIIIPFHKQWIIGGMTESSFAFKQLNKNVLEKAPCSVGVLIDRGSQKRFWCGYMNESIYQVAVFFFGGADDREALAYAKRMLDQPNVHITLFHFSSSIEIVGGTDRSKMLDTQILSEFRLSGFRNDRVSYKEEMVMKGRDVLSVIEYMENFYDLVMVGRRHADSKLMSELRKWKHGELGIVGELLASLNIGDKTSILVVQQQFKFWGSRDPEDSTHLRRTFGTLTLIKSVEMDDEKLDDLSSTGMIGNEKLVCQYIEKHATRGIWLGDNPLHHTTSVLIVQITLIFIISRTTHLLLRPCHQTLLISQIVAGIVLGPLLLSRNKSGYELLFPAASKMTLTTFAEFGMIIHYFKMGVQVDPTLIFKIEKQAMIIGIVGHVTSIVLSSAVLNVVDIINPLGSEEASVHGLVVVGALTAFPVISSFLNEMNILNSEVGRMALSTSMIEFWDSFALALVMCCKGLIDLSVYNILLNSKDISELSFTLMIYTMVIVTGFATIVLYFIYDPSRRYKTYIRKSIKDSQKDLDLKVLVCVHKEENVYPIINLLQASNPTKDTPLSVFVVHLMELSGRAASVLTVNKSTNKSCPNKQTSSQHISNVFDQFQLHNKGCVTLQCCTAIAPYASMHDDICYMAMDTKSNIVIVPFHKEWFLNGTVEDSNASIRTINQKVLNKAPCSVGVLIDRSQMRGKLLVVCEKSFCEIAMIFLGGDDDQEALAYSIRLAQHPNVRLTVFWIRVNYQRKHWNMKNPYVDLVEHTRYSNSHKGKVIFKEEVVEDGAGTTQVIRTMEGQFSLIIVGRHHIPDSPCTLGLTEWCELPELGPVGNLLATSDFTFSVLVVQQQPCNYDFRCIR